LHLFSSSISMTLRFVLLMELLSSSIIFS
jgi:hypothetical protein